MTTEMNKWFDRAYEEYLSKLHKEIYEKQEERFKRLKEKYPDAKGMLILSK